ncbi:MAG: glycoside hydrolase family 25 [Anaerolineaceae bacterium]|nr:MAG: glycoside hydrolase family 25 [Anaerolineaceae bacterium]
MKKLIFYIPAIIIALVLLIYIINFAGRILKTLPNNQGETETNLLTNEQDKDQGIAVEDDDKVDLSNPADDNDLSQDDRQFDDVSDVNPKDEANNNQDSENFGSDNEEDVPVPEPVVDLEDPQEEGSEGISMDVREIEKKEYETDDITYGIDVAKWQGVIDWAKVKEAGVEFAMIRVGYRTQVSGEITEDPYAKYNLQQAEKHDIKIGVYFFSTAINKKEAEEEAKWVAKFIAPYKITYPVVYNCEGFTDSNNRQFQLSKEKRTNLAIVFLDYIQDKGYTPMFYASKNELEDSRDWDSDSLTKKYKIWVAQYPDTIALNSKSSYSGTHEMWQYTNNGIVPGIKGSVDLNIAYFGYKNVADAKNNKPVEEVSADPLALISFKKVNETVTAKEVTNLRDIPGTDTGSKVIDVLYYGDTATRTGIGDNGWSRVEYKGKILYAITSYLTTNLSYADDILKPTLEDPEAGIAFTEVNEKVTAKLITNLRLVPATDSDDTIVVSLENGQIATRTGIGSNGWSRVEYEGQTLYAVTNYLEIVEE